MLRLIPTLVLLALAFPAPVLRAQDPGQVPPAEGSGEVRSDAPPAANGAAEVRLSLDEAVALVRERTGGRVVRADPRPEGSALIYEIRVLTTDGRVRTYRVDAASGTMR